MRLLKPILSRDRKLTLAITAELEQRLEQTRKRCDERGLRLPLEEQLEEFLTKLLAAAEADLAGERSPKKGRPRNPPANSATTHNGAPEPTASP